MHASGAQLARMLGANTPGVVRSSTETQAGTPGAFADLVRLAQEGKIRSGRAVSQENGVDAGFSRAQLDSIAQAADRAEAGGARSLLVVAGDTLADLDIASRTITGAVQHPNGGTESAETGFRLGAEAVVSIRQEAADGTTSDARNDAQDDSERAADQTQKHAAPVQFARAWTLPGAGARGVNASVLRAMAGETGTFQ